MTGADAPSVRTPSAAGVPPEDRQRKILGRYVFGDDFKPAFDARDEDPRENVSAIEAFKRSVRNSD